MRKILPALLCILLLSTSSPAAPKKEFRGSFTPGTNGEKLLSLLVSLTNPEVLELRMDEEPDDQGNVRNIHFLVKDSGWKSWLSKRPSSS